MIIMHNKKGTSSGAELQNLEKIHLVVEHIHGHPTVSLEQLPLMSIPCDAIKLMYAVKQFVIIVIIIFIADKLICHQGYGVAHLVCSRFFLAGRQNPVLLRIHTFITKRKLAEINIPEIRTYSNIDTITLTNGINTSTITIIKNNMVKPI